MKVVDNAKNETITSGVTVATKEKAKPQVGDYVNYQPDTVSTSYSLSKTYSGWGSDQTISQETLEWRVLKVHTDGSMDLIGTPTSQNVEFDGAVGYNNGVYLMHDICKTFYSKKSASIEARSVNLEDFENAMTETGKAARDAYSNYGKTYTTSLYTYYPSLYARENGSGINTTTVKTDGINATDKYYEAPTTETYARASKLKYTSTLFRLAINEENYGKAAKVLGNSNDYWIASRNLVNGATWTQAFYCLSTAYAQGCGGRYVFGSDGKSFLQSCDDDARLYDEWYYKAFLRPVVTLKPSAELTLETEGTDGNIFNITKY